MTDKSAAIGRRPAAGSEAELALIWAGQLFRRGGLRTEDGQALRIVYRGLPGAGPGPDFREAIVATPLGPRRGDVELHVRAGDFRRHGHHRNAAYAGVVLHVVFEAEGETATALPGGGSAPLLVLPRPAGRARRWEPARAWAEPCATALDRLGAETAAATLDRLGEMRFRQKTHAVRRRLAAQSADEVIWAALLDGLAYGGDRAAFRRLVAGLPWARLSAAMRPLPAAARAAAAREALGRQWEMGNGNGPGSKTAFAGVPAPATRPARPGNDPGRRLDGAAVLAARFAANGPAGALLPLLELPAQRAARALIAALSVPRLVGRGRAGELAANAVLPLAAALAAFPAAEAHAESVYAALPLPARYGAVRHLQRALAPLRPSMRRQQGMLYLLKQYCTQGGCGRCPLS